MILALLRLFRRRVNDLRRVFHDRAQGIDMIAGGDNAVDVLPVRIGKLGGRRAFGAVRDDVGPFRRVQHPGLHTRLVIGDGRRAVLVFEPVRTQKCDIRADVFKPVEHPAADQRVGASSNLAAAEKNLMLGFRQQRCRVER